MGAEEFGIILDIRLVLWGLWYPKLRYIGSVGKDFGGQGSLGRPSGIIWGALGTNWGALGTIWGPFWDTWGPFGDPLGVIWGALGTLWGPFGDPLGTLGDPLGTLWGPLGSLGDPSTPFWRSQGPKYAKYRGFRGFSGGSGGPQGPQAESTWGVLTFFFGRRGGTIRGGILSNYLRSQAK